MPRWFLSCLGNFGKLNVTDTLKTKEADALVYGTFPPFDFRNPYSRKTHGLCIGASPAFVPNPTRTKINASFSTPGSRLVATCIRDDQFRALPEAGTTWSAEKYVRMIPKSARAMPTARQTPRTFLGTGAL